MSRAGAQATDPSGGSRRGLTARIARQSSPRRRSRPAAPRDTYSNPALGYERRGDYTDAVSDGTFVWLAGEYIPARPRAIDANWGTFIARVGDDDG